MRPPQVSYYYDPEIGNFYYGHGHPMKPHRVRMAHGLIVRYGLHRHMEVCPLSMRNWEAYCSPCSSGQPASCASMQKGGIQADDEQSLACHSLPMQVLRPVQMSEETMQMFHTKEYIDFLKNVTPENQASRQGFTWWGEPSEQDRAHGGV
jgi:acetoin utilization deacetylase AcuC-like enzyme